MTDKTFITVIVTAKKAMKIYRSLNNEKLNHSIGIGPVKSEEKITSPNSLRKVMVCCNKSDCNHFKEIIEKYGK